MVFEAETSSCSFSSAIAAQANSSASAAPPAALSNSGDLIMALLHGETGCEQLGAPCAPLTIPVYISGQSRHSQCMVLRYEIRLPVNREVPGKCVLDLRQRAATRRCAKIRTASRGPRVSRKAGRTADGDS